MIEYILTMSLILFVVDVCILTIDYFLIYRYKDPNRLKMSIAESAGFFSSAALYAVIMYLLVFAAFTYFTRNL